MTRVAGVSCFSFVKWSWSARISSGPNTAGDPAAVAREAGTVLQVHLLRPCGEMANVHVLEHASAKGGHDGSSRKGLVDARRR